VLGAGAALVSGVLALAALAAVATGGVMAPLVEIGTAVSDPAASDPAAVGDIPSAMLALYERASASCPGLPWAVLAAIGTVESDNGRSSAPGVHSGANDAGAEGPMQFEPATFAAYDRPVPSGGVRPPSPYDPTDAVFAAARYLCADGGRDAADLPAAVYAYDHSDAYVDAVLSLAGSYEAAAGGGGAGVVAVRWALAQVGTPYVWGGETPGVGFDCSGLVQAAWAAAGVHLPRVAQAQFDAGPSLPAGAVLRPGDLVFFGASAGAVTHVGMYVGVQDGSTVMVDAPHTGAYVRVEPFPDLTGAPWGDDVFVGATRPG
jgi:cell wall-associated NlpC family hydrolase